MSCASKTFGGHFLKGGYCTPASLHIITLLWSSFVIHVHFLTTVMDFNWRPFKSQHCTAWRRPDLYGSCDAYQGPAYYRACSQQTSVWYTPESHLAVIVCVVMAVGRLSQVSTVGSRAKILEAPYTSLMPYLRSLAKADFSGFNLIVVLTLS